MIMKQSAVGCHLLTYNDNPLCGKLIHAFALKRTNQKVTISDETICPECRAVLATMILTGALKESDL